jgi:hypothetical protein
MGKKWDSTGVAFRVETWREVFRVLKPGAYLVACGGTRTYHRMVVAIEDAGFEVRDSLAWLYGSGFPKSMDISKAIDKQQGAEREVIGANPNHRPVSGVNYEGVYAGGNTGAANLTSPCTDDAKKWEGWGTALKPAYEPIVVARKPFKGTLVENVLTHGTGGLNIDACRLDGNESTERVSGSNGNIYGADNRVGMIRVSDQGRWPANVVIDEVAAAAIDEQSGDCRSAGNYPSDAKPEGLFGARTQGQLYDDVGGASRFYYCAKPSREERDMGFYAGKGNNHPTVKPVELMRWLVKLVTPVDGIVLDPFTGSGTTGMACAYEQRKFVGVEREAEYIEIAKRRIASVAPLFTDI